VFLVYPDLKLCATSDFLICLRQAIKKQRTPLSVAKPAMKNQQKREQKKIEEVCFLITGTLF
jgi:hypothetical protein